METEKEVSSSTIIGCSLVDRMSRDLDEVRSLCQSNDLLQRELYETQKSRETTESQNMTQRTRIITLEEEAKALAATKSLEIAQQQERISSLEANLSFKAQESTVIKGRIDVLDKDFRDVKEQNRKLLYESGELICNNRAHMAESVRLKGEQSELERELKASQQLSMQEVVRLEEANTALDQQLHRVKNAEANIRRLRQTEQEDNTQVLREVRSKLGVAEREAQRLARLAESQTPCLMGERQQYMAAHLELSYDLAFADSQRYAVSYELGHAQVSQRETHKLMERQAEQIAGHDAAILKWARERAAEQEMMRQKNLSIDECLRTSYAVADELVQCKTQLGSKEHYYLMVQKQLEDAQSLLAAAAREKQEHDDERTKLAAELMECNTQLGSKDDCVTLLEKRLDKQLTDAQSLLAAAAREKQKHDNQVSKLMNDAQGSLAIAKREKQEHADQLSKLMHQAGVRGASLMQLKRERDDARSECHDLRLLKRPRKQYIESHGVDKALRPTIYDLYSMSNEVEVVFKGRTIPHGLGNPRRTASTSRDKKLKKGDGLELLTDVEQPEQSKAVEELEQLEEGPGQAVENISNKSCPWVLSRHKCLTRFEEARDQKRKDMEKSRSLTNLSDRKDAQPATILPREKAGHETTSTDSPPAAPKHVGDSRSMASQRDKEPSVSSRPTPPVSSKPVTPGKLKSQAEDTLPTPTSPSLTASNSLPIPQADRGLGPSREGPQLHKPVPDKPLLMRQHDGLASREHSSVQSSGARLIPKRPRHEDEMDDLRQKAPKCPRSFNQFDDYAVPRRASEQYYRSSQGEFYRPNY